MDKEEADRKSGSVDTESDDTDNHRPQTADDGDACGSPPQWLNMSFTGSPLFEMLSRLAPGRLDRGPEELDVESLTSTSPASSLSASSLTSETSANGKENHLIWVEPVMSCRIFERVSYHEHRAGRRPHPPSMRFLRRGAARTAAHGPTSTSLQNLQAMPRRASRKREAPGGTGDMDNAGKEPRLFYSDDVAESVDNDIGARVTRMQTADSRLVTDALSRLTIESKTAWTKQQTQQETGDTALSSQLNNNHPGEGDECQQSKDVSDVSHSCLVKRGEDDGIQEGDGDNRMEAKDIEKDSNARSPTFLPETQEGRALPSPLLVKTVDKGQSSNAISQEQHQKLQEQQQQKQRAAVLEKNDVHATNRSVASSGENQPCPFTRGTFRSWRPDAIISDPGGIMACSKTQWSSHVTREQRFSRGYLSRPRAERGLQSEFQNRINRTSQTTRLSDHPYEPLPEPLEPSPRGVEALQVKNGASTIGEENIILRFSKDTGIGENKSIHDSMLSQTIGPRNNELRHFVTLQQIQDALDIALQNLSKISGQNSNENIANVDDIMPACDSQEIIDQPSIENDDPEAPVEVEEQAPTDQTNQRATSETVKPILINVISNSVETGDSVNHSCDKEQAVHSQLETGANNEDSGLSSIPEAAMSRNEFSDHVQEIFDDQPETLEVDARNVHQGHSDKKHVHFKRCVPEVITMGSSTESISRHMYSPPQICVSVDNAAPSREPAGFLDTNRERGLRDESPILDEYSKSLTDDTFATASPTVQDGDDSNETASPVQDTNVGLCQNYLSLVSDLPESSQAGARIARGEGDGGHPCVKRTKQNGNGFSESRICWDFETLDAEALGDSEARLINGLSDAEECKVTGHFRATSERKSRRTDSFGTREWTTIQAIGKAASDSLLARPYSQRPLSQTNRQNRVSDTLLFLPTASGTLNLNPTGSSVVPRRIEDMVNGDSMEKWRTCEDNSNVVRNREGFTCRDEVGKGEPNSHHETVLEAQADDGALCENRGDTESEQKPTKRSFKQRVNSLLGMCWRKK